MTNFFKTIWNYKWLFSIVFVCVFSVLLGVFAFLGLVPTEIRDASETIYTGKVATSTTLLFPTHISIPKIGVDVVVANPATTSVAVLDKALLSGAVRYPDSGTIGKGNMFLFGHSTGFRVVHNQAYKAFNNLKDLKNGDSIYIKSTNKEFIYKVSKVTLVDSDKALVDFKIKKNILTLSTCNTFGEKQERYVVEADFVGEK